jgi:uncharacterized protein YcaQ
VAAEDDLTVSPDAARRFLVRAFALDGFQTLPDVPAALDRLEFVQEDSINVCGRIHDLILWARVRDYAPADLSAALYDAPRRAFEYYFPNLCALPIRDFPHFAPAMRRYRGKYTRWGQITDEERPVVVAIEEILDGAQGPLRTRESGAAHGHTTSGWGTRTRLMAHVADKLWLHGRLGIARRENFERSFDRIERLFPPEVLEAALPDEDEERRYLARKRLRAKRLFRAKREDAATLGKGALRTVRIAGVKRPWQVLAEDADTLARAGNDAPISDTVHLLAPLDPLVYDRERNRDLWDFDYTWEVYTPAAKRRWGYYVLPVLRGDRLVGRVDPKIDRRTGTLILHSLTLEPGVDATDDLILPLAERLRGFARLLGAARIEVTACEFTTLRDAVAGRVP